ncbi:MAG: prolipoprotein diacylglyceryl transferase [Candidatus Limnocylindrales bacterium]|jgi:phosphatidylglycerol:prolipoprotein diacylglycerol transferase
MIDFTPNPVALSVGSLEIRWYGIGYVAAIVVATWLAFRLARQRGERTDVIVDSLIVIAIAALIGGRAYHVIDQWAYYQDHLAQIVLPPYSGLGIYGGLATGTLAVIWLVRHYRVSFWRWGDIIAPCILIAQVVGRWGNFMNQELYGPPTTLPWGIAIQCQYRVAEYACPPGSDPNATLGQHFIPLFFYESMLSLVGVFVMIFLWNRFTARGRLLIAGDVGLLYFVWYGVERSVLETFRSGWNWTFFGLATAQLVGLGAAAVAIVTIVVRHRWAKGHPETAAGVGIEAVLMQPEAPPEPPVPPAPDSGEDSPESGELAGAAPES